MKTKQYLLIVLTGVITFLCGLNIGKGRTEKPHGTVTETRETTLDTNQYYAPIPQSELALGTQRYTEPVYRNGGGGYGGEPRQRGNKESISVDTINTVHYGSGAGGEPRCSKDSAIVELPIIQRHYADSTYEAWISGPVDPRIDSLRVFARTTVITRREWKPPKRWHVGPTIGIGLTTHGAEPFVGISLIYSLFSF